MTAKINLQTLKGFRDFLPEEKRRRDFLLNKIIETFKIFGFESLETPTLEYASLLLGKYGDEADKLLYTFKDKGDREVALRFDQTVPTARVLSQYQNVLPKFFRRYQIQNVYRAEKPQSGRFREFTQCDIDIFGTTSPVADAEILVTTYYAFKNIGYPTVNLLINDRQTLFNCLKPFSTNSINVFSIIQSLDKLEKFGKEKVVEELIKKGLREKTAEKIINQIQKVKQSDNLSKIIDYSIQLGVGPQDIKFSPTLARGLDYYTGMIFEVVIPEYSKTSSCGGGGRYDKLINQLGGVDIPAVGIAFGFDRMVEAAQQLKIIPQNKTETNVLVTFFSQETIKQSLKISQQLRKNGITTEVFPAEEKLDKQLKYADKKGIPYVVIIGPEEAEKNVYKLKDMKTSEQKTLNEKELIEFLISSS